MLLEGFSTNAKGNFLFTVNILLYFLLLLVLLVLIVVIILVVVLIKQLKDLQFRAQSLEW